ncbi:MAG: hypothetical protein CMI53_05300 [Parcubacteria group bacterium]|jgi:hypothetical protein|nr:hypothetical protein [Parcubacteria group bacterium]|tara:strand:+ start:118 stop:573 length:456 start_codon:yes stop_codon:yes gene_type:complete
MKLIAKIIIIVTIFAAGFYIGQQALAPANGSKVVGEENSEQITVSLMFDFGDGEVRTFNDVVLSKNATMLELLEKVTTDNDLEFRITDYGGGLGALIESINNYSSDARNNRYWHFWVNNVYSDIGASNYILENSDVVEWKYTLNQFNLIVN